MNSALNTFGFATDLFGLTPGWVQEFCEELEKRNLKIPFKIQSRSDLLLRDGYRGGIVPVPCCEEVLDWVPESVSPKASSHAM